MKQTNEYSKKSSHRCSRLLKESDPDWSKLRLRLLYVQIRLKKPNYELGGAPPELCGPLVG